MKLCIRCTRFSLHDFARLPEHTYSVKLLDVEAGTRDLCSLCAFLYSELEQSLLSFQIHPSKIWVRLRNHVQLSDVGKDDRIDQDRKLHIYELELYLADTRFETKAESKTAGIFLGVAASPNSSAAQDGTIAGRYYGEEPGSSAQLGSILEWMSTCLVHDRCRRTVSGRTSLDAKYTLLPTRCIEVSHKGKSCHLRDTAGQYGSYITLSHRWNSQTHQCKLTTSNIDRLKDGQGFGLLSKTFQDAISLTQHLGIRYIWIDSLCIIQDGDDGADWIKESDMMSQYYQTALLTLSFIGETPMQSILDLRGPDPFKSLLRMPYDGGKGWYYIYRPFKRPLSQFVQEVRQSDMLRRGWIFQEWFLSRRIIYCTPSQLFFECQSRPPMNERRQSVILEAKETVASKVRDKMQSCSDFDIWYDIVELYSGTDLTRPDKDRLVAISGVAKELQDLACAKFKPEGQEFKQYVSGLWLQDLHKGLLWQDRASESRSCSCNAPSWSWASRQGTTRWLTGNSGRITNVARIRALKAFDSRIYPLEDLKKPKCSASDTSLDDNDALGSNPFSTASMTAGILLSGKVNPVVVRESPRVTGETRASMPLPDFDTVRILARETDIRMDTPKAWQDNLDCLYAAEWSLIFAPSTPDIIGGWASLDDKSATNQLASYDGAMLLALHIRTRQKVGKSKGVADHRTRHNTIGREVYEVLLIEPVDKAGHQYRRVGVGSIFDSQIMGDFDDSDDLDIELI